MAFPSSPRRKRHDCPHAGRRRPPSDNSKKRPQGAQPGRESYARGRGVASRLLAWVHRSSRSAVAPESTAAAARASPSPSALASESDPSRSRRSPPEAAQPGGGHRGGRVEQHDVADRPGLAGQHRAHRRPRSRPGRRRAGRRRTRGAGRARPGRTSVTVTAPSQATQTVDGPVVLSSSRPPSPWNTRADSPRLGVHPGQHRAHRRVGDADRQRRRPGRVGQRPQVVERRRHARGRAGPGPRAAATGGTAAANRNAMPTSANSASVAAAGRSITTPSASSTSADAAGRGRGPVAVLDHRHPGRGRHDGRHRGHVDRVQAVAAGPDQVGDRAGDGDRGRVRQHRGGQPGHLGSAVSPLARSATPNPAIWAGEAAPSMISFIAQAVCSAVSARPPMSARISAGQLGVSIVGTYSARGRTPEGRSKRSVQYRYAFDSLLLGRGDRRRPRERMSAATSLASATGSIGWLITASARDQVASQRSSARPMTSSAGGQL